MFIHTGNRPYFFKICHKIKNNETNNLKKHLLIHIHEKDHTHTYSVWKTIYSGVSPEESHVYSYRKETTYVLCMPKQFTQRCNLNRHMLIHAGYRLYPCRVCNNVSRPIIGRRIHSLIQKKDRIFLHYMVYSSVSLEKSLVNTRQRPYTWSVYEEQFVQAGYLKRHMLITLGMDLIFARYAINNLFRWQA